MRIKFIFIFFIFFNITVNIFAQDKWVEIDSIDYRYGSIIDLKCCDSLNCMYLVNKDKLGGFHIQRTTDGGETWKKVYMDSAYFKGADDYHLVPKIHSLSYPNEKLCIAVGDSGLVLRSTDKGETWDVYRIDTLLHNYNIKMYDNNIGLLLTGNFRLGKYARYKTTNGGRDWILKNYPTKNTKIGIEGWNIEFLNPDKFVTTALYKNSDSILNKYLLYLYNNWESWDTVRAPLYSTYLTFGDENNVWTAGNHDELDSAGWSRYRQYIYHSSDGGHSWVTQWGSIYEGGTLKDIEFYDNEFGVAGGMDALTLITDDGGGTWDINLIKDTPPDGSAKIVNNIEIPDRNTVYVVYNFRRIYKLKRTTTSAAEQSQSPGIILTPNPAGDYIDIAVAGNRTLKDAVRVYDVLGNTVLSSPACSAGTPSEGGHIRLDVSGLAAGVYFVKIDNKMYKFVKM